MIPNGNDTRFAMASALVEAAVRGAVLAGAPRRTVVAVAVAVARSVGAGQPAHTRGDSPESDAQPPTQTRRRRQAAASGFAPEAAEGGARAGSDSAPQTEVSSTRPRRKRRRKKPVGAIVPLVPELARLDQESYVPDHPPFPSLGRTAVAARRGVKALCQEDDVLDRGEEFRASFTAAVAKSRRRTISQSAGSSRRATPSRRSDSPGGSEESFEPAPTRRRTGQIEPARVQEAPWAPWAPKTQGLTMARLLGPSLRGAGFSAEEHRRAELGCPG